MKPTVRTGKTFVWVLQLVLVGFLQAPIQGASQGTTSAAVHAGGQVDVFSGTDRNAVQISSSRFR